MIKIYAVVQKGGGCYGLGYTKRSAFDFAKKHLNDGLDKEDKYSFTDVDESAMEVCFIHSNNPVWRDHVSKEMEAVFCTLCVLKDISF
jgi:hypothetical protein